jgi:radical SAM superfamily enzyme YgiQ (UPF0313 family)
MRFQLIYPKWPKLPGQNPFDLPPLGVIQAAASVPAGIDVAVTNENVEAVDFDGAYDLVGISIMLTCQAPRAYEIADEFRRRGKPVVMGGLHVALCPDEAALHADAVVVGEGEELIPRMIADFQDGRMAREYRRTEGLADISRLPNPRRDLHDKKRLYTYKGWELVDLVETSRGCRYNCYPCCTPYLGGRIHRTRPIEHVLSDLRSCSDLVFIVDNSLEQDVEYQKNLFRAMIGEGKRWISHPITPEPEVLDLAQKSGCWWVYHAIYTISDKIRDRVKMFHDYGIAVEGTILLGLKDHTEDFIKRFVDFLLTIELDLAEFTVLTPFPHTQVYDELETEGRIIDRDWRNYNASTVVYRPWAVSPEKLQELYFQAWDVFYKEQSQNARMGKLFWNVAKESAKRRKELGETKRG